MKCPKFLDRVRAPVSHGRMQTELDNYASDIRRGATHPSMSFLEYVKRYAHWTLIETKEERHETEC
jgi:hypothetical protein